MDRANFVIGIMKQVEPKIFYDHGNAEFYSTPEPDEGNTSSRFTRHSK